MRIKKCNDGCCEAQARISPPVARGGVKLNGAGSNPATTEGGELTNENVLNFAFISFVIFTCIQFIFALAARSQSMLTDCAAMTVDCVSYLINFMAERLKHKPLPREIISIEGDHLSAYEQHYRKKMRLLLLELAPPFISVATLIAVTLVAIQQAVHILLDTDPNDKRAPPNLFLMLLFSSLNFVLDGINVMCFAKADQAKGLSQGFTAAIHPEEYVHQKEAKHERACCNNHHNATEKTHLLSVQGTTEGTIRTQESDEEDLISGDSKSSKGLNLNMCSAWTHICADTLRSIAVLSAAGFASLFPTLMTPADADSYGAIVVSVIIIISLGPLIEGLYFTAWEIWLLYKEPQRQTGDEVLAVSLAGLSSLQTRRTLTERITHSLQNETVGAHLASFRITLAANSLELKPLYW